MRNLLVWSTTFNRGVTCTSTVSIQYYNMQNLLKPF